MICASAVVGNSIGRASATQFGSFVTSDDGFENSSTRMGFGADGIPHECYAMMCSNWHEYATGGHIGGKWPTGLRKLL